MAVIIFIILFALYACINGDSSGIEAIAKIISGIILFIVVGSIAVFMMDNPILLIGIVALIIIIALIHNSTKSNSSNINQETKQSNIQTNIDKKENEISMPTSIFQKELEQNSKSITQIEEAEFDKFKSSIETEYTVIKIKIKKMAENAQYTIENGQKIITIDYKSYILESFISRKCETVYLNKTILKPSGEYGHKLVYSIKNNEKYNYYIKTLNDLSKNDNILITPIMFKQNDKDFRTIPCVIQGFALTIHTYEQG